jgi:hypothetical protein
MNLCCTVQVYAGLTIVPSGTLLIYITNCASKKARIHFFVLDTWAVALKGPGCPSLDPFLSLLIVLRCVQGHYRFVHGNNSVLDTQPYGSDEL